MTTAPLLATRTTAPLTGVDCAAITSTCVSLSDSMLRTSTEASVTEATAPPPPLRLEPDITTRVSSWPVPGVTEVIAPGAVYAQPVSAEIKAPVLAMMVIPFPAPSTAMSPISPLPSWTIRASVSPRKTRCTDWPPPKRLSPRIVTSVPFCPELGVTDVILLATKVQALSSEVTMAPVSAVMVIVTLD